jgi:TolB-like protein/DNA-binding winged helix-turn-helix (wHTH) protein
MNQQPPGRILAFDDIRIDVDGHRLYRGGAEQPLEPRAFAVLLQLAGRPGHVFARDDLLDAVWGHTHVTPGTLNRIITLLRHALGEDAQRPRYLHTVHGVGYRFDASIAPDDVQPVVEVASPPVLAVAAADRGAVDIADALSAATNPTSVDLESAFSRSVASIGLLAVLALAFGSVVLLWPPRDGPSAPTRAAAPKPSAPAAEAVIPPTLAVLPLRPLGEEIRSADFADGLSEELINLLSRLEGLRVTSRTSSFQFRDSDATPAQIAQLLNATHLLEGSVRQEGRRIRIALRLVDAAQDRTLWSETYDREFRDIFQIQENVATAVGGTLRLRLGLTPGGKTSDEDPELYLRYLQARQVYGRQPTVPRNVTPALASLRALVEEHPDYARAWGGLAAISWATATLFSPNRNVLRAESEQAAYQALRLDPSQPDAHAVLSGVACREQRWNDCLASSRLAVEGAPSDTLWRGWHAHRLATVGYVEEALREVDRALAIDPLASPLLVWRGRVLDTLGRHDEAKQEFDEVGPLPGQTALFYNAMWRGDLEEARSLADSLSPAVPWAETQRLAIDALIDPAKGAALRAAIAVSEKRMGEENLSLPYDFNRWFLPERDYAIDIKGFDGIQREGFATYHWNMWMPAERGLRQSDAFQQYVRRTGLLAYWREHGWPDRCRSDGGEGLVCD